jgi:hypothetical protein
MASIIANGQLQKWMCISGQGRQMMEVKVK